jgi:hypothetical protein
VFVVSKQVQASGVDFYGNSVGPIRTITFAIWGLFLAFLQTAWLFVIPIMFFQILNMIPRKSLDLWASDSRVALIAYGGLVLTYASQCALYHSTFPRGLRYDFPAMLLVPLTCCILACEISRIIRSYFSERTIDYAQLTAAGFVIFGLIFVYSGKSTALSAAVTRNIRTTNLFYGELQRLVGAAEHSPNDPIILEAYGPGASEAVYSLSYYIPALGAHNHISVRLHSNDSAKGQFYEGLEQDLAKLQAASTGGFSPLLDAIADSSHGCISVGLGGPPDAACSGFQVSW